MAGLRRIELGLVVVIAAMLSGRAMAQTGCTAALVGLTPCLNYITGNSSTPTSSCCSQLSSVAQSQPMCLCSVLDSNGVSLGFTLNRTLALQLPGACNVQTPIVSQCNAAGSGAGADGPAASAVAPAHSPSDDTPDQIPDDPTDTDIPSGSNTIPAQATPSDAGYLDPLTHLLVVALCFLLSVSINSAL
uniref:Bifunctional inhibitor/plant lipid transfer protein/seed storage helical domain-containing protein n=1 Tax=Kalanchoe fedtschenkoi TaxID=63787 RepID=A0A7N0ZVU7_KALFE